VTASLVVLAGVIACWEGTGKRGRQRRVYQACTGVMGAVWVMAVGAQQGPGGTGPVRAAAAVSWQCSKTACMLAYKYEYALYAL